MAEWGRTDLPYAARVQHLLHGGGNNGSITLDPSAFSTNGGHNSLLGVTGLDLFYGFQTLETTDWNASQGEVFVNDRTVGQTRIDSRGLSLQKLLLDGTQALDVGLGAFAPLTPGTHTLFDYLGGNGSVTFTVAADGTVDYDHALDGVLSGRGTNTLVVKG